MRTPISRTIRQLGFLRVGPTAATNAVAEDERVMRLFRNRAELKKSYNQLCDQVQQLQDRLKQQEGVTARAQEHLQALQARLALADTAYPTVVFYQLRDLWHVAHGLLEQHMRELHQQREAIERGVFQRDFQQQRELRVAALDRGCQELQVSAQTAAALVQSLTQQIARERGWWRYLQRRLLRRQLQAASLRDLQVADALQAARNERELVAAEPEPHFPGLSLAMRRAVNVAVIAYAHVLHGRVESSGLLDAVRRAMAIEEVPPGEYGDRAACELLMAQIQRTRWSLQQRLMLKDELQQVTMGLRPLLRYASDFSSIPDAAALADETVGTRVLQDNAWEISRLLL